MTHRLVFNVTVQFFENAGIESEHSPAEFAALPKAEQWALIVDAVNDMWDNQSRKLRDADIIVDMVFEEDEEGTRTLSEHQLDINQ